MTREQFERILDKVAERLGREVRESTKYHSPLDFQERVVEVLKLIAAGEKIQISPTWHPHAFPDVRANGFGVEVKSTTKDSWLSVGNSIFESMREPGIDQIYVLFGKMGGMPGVKWGRYEDRVTHVRISHAPRFVVEMNHDSSLFPKMGVGYNDFCTLPPEEKMHYVRKYSRSRLKSGERLWWLEDENSPGTPLEVRLYMDLSKSEKKRLRGEAAILFPQVVSHSRTERYKYIDPAFFLLKYRNVFCPQTRDLFSAGSVAGAARGGNYVLRALENIEQEMRDAALRLDDALFVEYWDESVEPRDRIAEWLRRADKYARNWVPSKHLFIG